VKSTQEIENRIKEIEERLVSIDHANTKQLETPFFERDYFVCQFLNLERRSYSLLLKELKWILDEQ